MAGHNRINHIVRALLLAPFALVAIGVCVLSMVYGAHAIGWGSIGLGLLAYIDLRGAGLRGSE